MTEESVRKLYLRKEYAAVDSARAGDATVDWLFELGVYAELVHFGEAVWTKITYFDRRADLHRPGPIPFQFEYVAQ